MKSKRAEFPLPYEVRIQYVRPLFKDMVHIKSSYSAYETIQSFIKGSNLDYKEHSWVMLLTRSNRLLGISHISMGSVSGTVVSTMELLQLAILSHSSGIILIHNHPSGCLKFSDADLKLSHGIQEAMKHIEIQLVDHLVITSEYYVSMADEGLLV